MILCAVIIKLVQGESGVNVLDKKYVKDIEHLCKDRHILLIVDKVQIGIGRTGTFLCSEQYGIHPNVVTLANSENRTAIRPFNASTNNYLSKYGGLHTKYALMIRTNQIYSVIERVRNIILDWSITLEENGILGEGLQFSDTEKEIANNTPVINHYINNFWEMLAKRKYNKIQKNLCKNNR